MTHRNTQLCRHKQLPERLRTHLNKRITHRNIINTTSTRPRSVALTGVALVADGPEHLVVLPRRDDAVGRGQGQPLGRPVQQLQLAGLALLLRLLPPQRHLRRHDALALGDQGALGAHAVLPAAVALVALERGHHAVVAAASALGRAGVLLGGAQEERRATTEEAAGHGHRDGDPTPRGAVVVVLHLRRRGHRGGELRS